MHNLTHGILHTHIHTCEHIQKHILAHKHMRTHASEWSALSTRTYCWSAMGFARVQLGQIHCWAVGRSVVEHILPLTSTHSTVRGPRLVSVCKIACEIQHVSNMNTQCPTHSVHPCLRHLQFHINLDILAYLGGYVARCTHSALRTPRRKHTSPLRSQCWDCEWSCEYAIRFWGGGGVFLFKCDGTDSVCKFGGAFPLKLCVEY